MRIVGHIYVMSVQSSVATYTLYVQTVSKLAIYANNLFATSVPWDVVTVMSRYANTIRTELTENVNFVERRASSVDPSLGHSGFWMNNESVIYVMMVSEHA